MHTQSYEEAARLFKTALSYNDKQADVHYDLANTYMKLQEVDSAIEHYLKGIEILKPIRRLEYYFNLGNAYSIKKDY